MADLRIAWHQFAAGQIGPDGVVAAARQACGAGVQRRAPSLIHLANLQPPQYGHVTDLFNRVRGELQAATAQAAQLQVAQPQAAYATGAATTAYPAAQPPGAYRMAPPSGPPSPPSAIPPSPPSPMSYQPGGQPGPYGVPPGYAQPGYAPAGYAPAGYVPPGFLPPDAGLPPGVRGITRKEFKDLRRVGWICAVAGLLIPLFAIMSIVNGQKLSKHGDSQGTPMMVIGIIIMALMVLLVVVNASSA